MPSVTVVLAAVAVAAFLLYKFILYPAFFSSFSSVPNAHWTCSFSPLWLRYQRRGGREAIAETHAAHVKKGPIVRLSPDEVSVASLEGLRTIYMGSFDRPMWFIGDISHYGNTPSLFTMPTRQSHAERRRQLAGVYSKTAVMASEDVRKLSESIVFGKVLPILDGVVKKGGELEALEFNRTLGTDFISAFMWGSRNGSNLLGKPEKARQFFRIQDKFLQHLLLVNNPGRKAAEDWVLEFSKGANDQLNGQTQPTKSDPDKTLAEKDDIPATTPLVFGHLAKGLSKDLLNTTVPGTTVSRTLAAETLDALLAGTEGPRITLSFLQWELSKRPALQSRLRQELLTLDPPITPSAAHLPSFQAVDALPLLDAVLMETLRMYPAAQTLQYRITPPEGCTLHGHRIPGGITASTAAYVLHRNEDVYPEPLEWKPERWFIESKDEEERVKEMRRWFWAFGSGSRMCVGKHIVELGTCSVSFSSSF